MWAIEGSTCSPSETSDGTVLTLDMVDSTWQVADIATGDIVDDLAVDSSKAYGGVHISARVGDVVLLDISSVGLFAVNGEEALWEAGIEAPTELHVLDDGLLAVTLGCANESRVLNLDTGETITTIHRDDPVWAADGYIVENDPDAPEYAAFDVDGDSVDTSSGKPMHAFVPTPAEGVLFPVEEHLAAGPVIAVAADGTPAHFENESGKVFTQDGEFGVDGVEPYDVAGVSADGSLFLLKAGQELTLIDSEGNELLTRPAAEGTLIIASGYFVCDSKNTTEVFLPQE